MKKAINKFLVFTLTFIVFLVNIISIDVKAEDIINDVNNNTKVNYQVSLIDGGWQQWKADGSESNSPSDNKGIESIKINYNNNLGLNLKYQIYNKTSGWQQEVSNGEIAGTTGEAIQAIKINILDKNLKEQKDYSVYYRVYLSESGWQNWTKDGTIAGAENEADIESIQMYIADNNSNNNKTITYSSKVYNTGNNETLTYSSHVQNIGNQAAVKDGEISGTVGKGLRIEGIKVNYNNQGVKVKYRAHVQNIGWQDYKSSGELAGTTGKGLAIEAIDMYLEDAKGKRSEDYSIYYRAHVADYGWQKWTSNGNMAGTTGKSKAIQAIQICIVKKGTTDYSKMEYLCNGNSEKISYKVHASRIGWESNVSDGNVAGNPNKSANNIESVETQNISSIGLKIKAQAHVSNIGWMNQIIGNEVTIGTVGKSLPIEALKLSLVDSNGKDSGEYSIFYRVYAGSGWLGWAKNGMQAGTTGKGLAIKAIQIYIKKVGTDECSNMNKQVNSKAAETASVSQVYVSKNQLIALGWKNVNDNMVNECNKALSRFGITTPARIRHFLSQCSYESGLGKYTKELSSGNQYEGRRDLGNVLQGDGAKFKGAGYIQVTGRNNYQLFCNYIGDKRVMEGCSYVSQTYPWSISAYWWYRNGMNQLADRGASVRDVTKRVNGGTRGLSTRKQYYNMCCNIFK